MSDVMQTWECRDGVGFLEAIGVAPADTVVDFGCRVGHYAIPAALAVGPSGSVYALDKDETSLEELRRKATDCGLRNIITIAAGDLRDVRIEDDSVDVVLLYDVLHYFAQDRRRELIRWTFRLLKPSGLLSVYPKHTADNWPSQEFSQLHVGDVIGEIQACGFILCGRLEGRLSHDDGLEHGCVLNFHKQKTKDVPLDSLQI